MILTVFLLLQNEAHARSRPSAPELPANTGRPEDVQREDLQCHADGTNAVSLCVGLLAYCPFALLYASLTAVCSDKNCKDRAQEAVLTLVLHVQGHVLTKADPI